MHYQRNPEKLNLQVVTVLAMYCLWLYLLVVPEKLPGQKRCDKEEEGHDFLEFSTSL